jgi:transposase-like protein
VVFPGGTRLVFKSAMHWPATPVEHLSGFQPHFCPRRGCSEHLRTTAGFRFRRLGFYVTSRRWRIPRFLCLTCKRSFSRQAFAVSYYSKRPELLVPVASGLVGGSAHRQIARTVGCAPTTVTRMAARLGRHAILLLARARTELAESVEEPFVLDHFETFECTQDYPFGVATLVGSRSWFVYDLDPAPHKRAGKITATQRARLAERPGRPAHGGYLGSTRRVLDRVMAVASSRRPIRLRGDGHEAYDRAVREHPDGGRVRLERHPNPPRGPKGSPRSPAARLRDARLFPVDLLHKILRHSLAHHRRETIAFGRRLNALMERLFLAAVWRNFVQRRSERRRHSGTPAMSVGLASEPWDWRRVLSRRLFPARTPTPATWASLYRRLWTTPLFTNSRHQLIRAF